MKPKLIFGLFLVLAIVQLATPLGQIWKYEDILKSGQLYKFRTAPVDPYDAFRGKYVALNYANTETVLRKGDSVSQHDFAYVSLNCDENGFAQFVELSSKPPSAGDYLRVEFLYSFDDKARFALPFDKLFMAENMAPQAERAYRSVNRRNANLESRAYILVRIKGGRGVIADLYINDRPIREFLRTKMNR
jgi:uncharacterized membrane-anchored protein